MKFHQQLNKKLWTGLELKSDVKQKLKEIAQAFKEYLDIPEDAILDERITGSSASYNYTQYSDLDLHLIIDYDKVHEDCPLVEGYLWSYKSQFNANHDISIYGVPVEVYAEDSTQEAVSNGVYSLRQDKWLKEPKKIPPTDNDADVQAKYQELKDAIDKCDDSEVANELLDKIYTMRKSGLAEVGEFSTENMAFKLLRNDGSIDKLKKLKKEKVDKQLSLESYNEEMYTDEKDVPPLHDYAIIFKYQEPWPDGKLAYRAIMKLTTGSSYRMQSVGYTKEGMINIVKKKWPYADIVDKTNEPVSESYNEENVEKLETLEDLKNYFRKVKDDVFSANEKHYTISKSERNSQYLKENKSTRLEELLDILSNKNYYKINGNEISIKETNSRLAYLSLWDLADKFKSLGYKVHLSHFYLEVEGLQDLLNSNKDSALQENDNSSEFTDVKKFNSVDEFKNSLANARNKYDVEDVIEGKDLLHLVYNNKEHIATYNNTKLELYYDKNKDFNINENMPETIYKPSLILQAYKQEQDWLKGLHLSDDEVAPQVMLFILSGQDGILDTKLVNRKDVYTYIPNDNEFYLDRTRDTGNIITDYNLEPAQKLVNNWNSAKDWKYEDNQFIETFESILKEAQEENSEKKYIIYQNKPVLDNRGFVQMYSQPRTLEECKRLIYTDIGEDKVGYIYQIRDLEGNIIETISWDEEYKDKLEQALEFQRKYSFNPREVKHILKLMYPQDSQEAIDKRLNELQGKYDGSLVRQRAAYYNGANWSESLQGNVSILNKLQESINKALNEDSIYYLRMFLDSVADEQGSLDNDGKTLVKLSQSEVLDLLKERGYDVDENTDPSIIAEYLHDLDIQTEQIERV